MTACEALNISRCTNPEGGEGEEGEEGEEDWEEEGEEEGGERHMVGVVVPGDRS